MNWQQLLVQMIIYICVLIVYDLLIPFTFYLRFCCWILFYFLVFLSLWFTNINSLINILRIPISTGNVCLGFFVPRENFSIIWRREHYRWRAAIFDLCFVLMAIEQWGFFSVPHLLLHWTSVFNGHIRAPVTLTPIAKRFSFSKCDSHLSFF